MTAVDITCKIVIMKQRLREMDFIRAAAALSIIAIHVTASYVYVSRGAYYINQLVRFAVPIFILISGLLLFASNREYKGVRGYFEFLWKRLKKIFVPYIIWSFIYILYSLRNDLGSIWLDKGAFLFDTGRKLLYGSAHAHLYFVIIMIQLYLLFPLLSYLMKRWPRLVLALSFLITLYYQTGVYLYLMKLIKFPYFLLPNYMFFPTWIFYFVFGMYFTTRMEFWKSKLQGKLLPVGAVWAVSLVVLLLDSRFTGTFSSSMKPSIMLYCITTFILMYSIFLLLRDKSHILLKGLDWLSEQSYFIYLAHLLVLIAITFISGRLGISGLLQGFPGMLAVYAATLAGSVLFAYIIALTPAATALGAVAKKRKRPVSSDNTASIS